MFNNVRTEEILHIHEDGTFHIEEVRHEKPKIMVDHFIAQTAMGLVSVGIGVGILAFSLLNLKDVTDEVKQRR